MPASRLRVGETEEAINGSCDQPRSPRPALVSAGSLSPTTTISETFARWYRFLITLTVMLIIEAVLAAIIRTRILVAVFSGTRPFGIIEALSAVGLVMFPVMLYAIVRIRTAQRDLDLLVGSEQESANATRVLLDTTTEGIYGIDVRGCCTMANRAAAECLGYAPEELIGRNMHELIHHTRADGSPYPVEECPIFKVLQEGEEHRAENDILWRKDGSSFSVAYSAAPIVNSGGTEGAVVTFTNIDDRKRADAALRESELRYRTVIETANDAYIQINDRSAIREWNSAAEKIFGIDKADALGHDLAELIIPRRYRDAHRAGLLRYLETGEGPVLNTTLELTALRDPGEEFPIELTIWPIRVGSEVTFHAFVRDITERKASEGAIRTAQQEAERANRAKSEFLSRMSHELRTPLNAILGFAQLLEMDELERDQRDSTEQIIKGGRRLLELINEVLDIARIESGRLALSLEPVLIGDLIDECIGLIRPLADERGIRVHSECTDMGQHVRADRHRLGQVLLNLLSNAVKYNADDGVVTVTCSAAPDVRFFRVSVTDTGAGIPPEKVPLLFTPFERLGPEGSEVEGTGLGLALSKNLMEAMGGRISVDTKEGEGTTFWIDVATAEQMTVQPLAPIGEESDASMGDYRILYIEDNLANLRLIERLLERRVEFELIPALSGTVGLDLARQNIPDLILLDLGLPDIKGDEVLARLREDPETARIPVIVLTADATPGEVKRLLAAGAEDYLTKPIDVAVFMRVLEHALGMETSVPDAHPHVPPSGE